MSQPLAIALNKLDEAAAHVAAVLLREYPVGDRVDWNKGRGWVRQSGHVVDHGDDGRLLVRNASTQRSYWICASHIAQAQP